MDGMAVANLNVIRRQRDPELRRAVQAAREAFELLRQQGRISEIRDVKQCYQRIAAKLSPGPRSCANDARGKPGNDERRNLNDEIRTLLVTRGYVEKEGREHQILMRRDLYARSNHVVRQLPGE